MKLTDKACKAARPKEKPYKLSDGGGMYLDVRKNGSKYWRMKYRVNGKEKLLALGVYPDISLAEARDKRTHAKRMISEGLDPSQEKQKRKVLSKENRDNTFEAIAREWHKARSPLWTPNYARGVLIRLEKDIFPEIGHYPIKEIEPPILLHAIRKIEARNAIEIARRQLQKCGEIFRYAIAESRAQRDPSADIKGALSPQKKTHYAALGVDELPEFIHALDRNDARLYQNTRNALRLMMLTFVRTSELINARWDEIDFEAKRWIIPAERMKMRKEHMVPLSDQAIAILRNQQDIAGHWPLVFPSPVRPRNPMSNNTILKAISALGFKGRMTGHGFRALAMSSIKEKLNYRHEVIDRQLAHAPKNKVDAAYDRAAFYDERTKMMQEWADYLDEVAAHGQVVPGDFKRRA